ncbi:unnamed protein product [Brassicogethes aeneus]|uniref:SANT domain-containing protein n=1 Tax=Brassicogethes aeneus TaxID=1431903 RepID=A0A9P0BCK9_BRAAE|nr:unnamed protein product [Brassicogethes aeneus]
MCNKSNKTDKSVIFAVDFVNKEVCKMEKELDIKVQVQEDQLLGSVTTYNNCEGSDIKSQQIRSSARVYKKMRLDNATPVIEKIEKKEDVKQDNKKCYRPLWTSDDKDIFFEALYEYGKDFESIQTHISTKLRKKGVPEHLIKTKDQIRHLYYRTWHKISKYLKFTEGIKKVVQELYGLINYGELRKRIGSVSGKTCMKLNELIYSGSIVHRIKGKNIRIKTPMCRALRRLNQLDERFDEIILPNRVTVELKPKDMSSFLRVQVAAQNPRLKAVLPLQKRLSSIISCMNKRWKTLDANLYDKSVISSNVVTNDCIPSKEIIEENKKIINPSVRLSPPTGCQIELPSINLSEYYTRQSICLASFENRLGFKTEDHYKKTSKKSYRQRSESISDKSPLKIEENTETSQESDPNIVNKVVDDAVNTILALQKPEQEVKKELNVDDDAEVNQNKSKIEGIKNGWTEEICGTLSIGEVYLMFGHDSKLILEYSWDDKPIKTEENKDPKEPYNPELSVSLNKLLSVAKMHYRKNIIKCPCGHVCGSKTSLKRAMESKFRKMLTDIDKCTEETESEDTEVETFAPPTNFPATKYHAITPAQYYQPNPPMVHLLTQLKPKYGNKRGKTPRSKQVVVERKLPLLPNNVESGHQIVRMNIISQENNTIKDDATTTSTTVYNSVNLTNSETQFTTTLNTIELSTFSSGNNNLVTKDNILQPTVETQNVIVDSALSITSSPSRLLTDNDNQWINSEVADYSLSSLLGNLESPMKSNLTNEDSRMSEDVDAQLRSLLTESSLDFSANFADLAAQVNEAKK